MINSQARDLMEYLLGGQHQVEILAVEGVREDGAGEMASDFHSLTELNPRLTGHLMHVALAFQPEEREISNAEMVEISLKYMQRMKVDTENTAWAIVRHTERDHQHVHLVISRIDYDGKTISDSHSHANSLTACRKIEKEYGFINAVETGATKKRASQELPERPWLESKAFIRDAVSRCLPYVASVDELVARLKKEGVETQPTFQKGKLQSVVFEHEGQHVKGSAVDRSYSGNNLTATIEGQREQVLAGQVQLEQLSERLGENSRATHAIAEGYGKHVAQLAADKKKMEDAAVAAAAKQVADVARAVLAEAEAQKKIYEMERLKIGEKAADVLKNGDKLYNSNDLSGALKSAGVEIDDSKGERSLFLKDGRYRFSTTEIEVNGQSLATAAVEKINSNVRGREDRAVDKTQDTSQDTSQGQE